MEVIMEEASIPHIDNLNGVGLIAFNEDILWLQITVDNVHSMQLIQPNQNHLGCLFYDGHCEELRGLSVCFKELLAKQFCLNEKMLSVVETLVVFQQVVLVSVAIGVDQGKEPQLVEALVCCLFLRSEYFKAGYLPILFQIVYLYCCRKCPTPQFLEDLVPPCYHIVDYHREFPVLFVSSLLSVVDNLQVHTVVIDALARQRKTCICWWFDRFNIDWEFFDPRLMRRSISFNDFCWHGCLKSQIPNLSTINFEILVLQKPMGHVSEIVVIQILIVWIPFFTGFERQFVIDRDIMC